MDLNINIYYGGRGIIDDPTIYVINKMQEVLEELRVHVERYNLYDGKTNITTLPQTLKEADGIILATTVEWYGIGGYMQQFLDACWLYGDKETIAGIYMCPVVMSTTYGEREGKLSLAAAWEILGGLPCSGICGYIENTVTLEMNGQYGQNVVGIEVDDAVFQLFVGGLIALFPLVLRYLFLRVRFIRHRTGELFVPAVEDVARTADVELFFDVRRRLFHPLAALVLAAFPDAVVVLARGADVEPGREVFPAFDADDAVDVLIRFCPVAARDLVRRHHDALQIFLRQQIGRAHV